VEFTPRTSYLDFGFLVLEVPYSNFFKTIYRSYSNFTLRTCWYIKCAEKSNFSAFVSISNFLLRVVSCPFLMWRQKVPVREQYCFAVRANGKRGGIVTPKRILLTLLTTCSGSVEEMDVHVTCYEQNARLLSSRTTQTYFATLWLQRSVRALRNEIFPLGFFFPMIEKSLHRDI
jgi:hypothetical protein